MIDIIRSALIVNAGRKAIACIFLACVTTIHAGEFITAEQESDKQAYRALVQSRINPIQINQIHQWELTLLDADGVPVENAEIAITGGMPAHNHGLPTAPRVTEELKPGVYLVEGMKFQMGGNWVVNFKITANDLTDTVTFNLSM